MNIFWNCNNAFSPGNTRSITEEISYHWRSSQEKCSLNKPSRNYCLCPSLVQNWKWTFSRQVLHFMYIKCMFSYFVCTPNIKNTWAPYIFAYMHIQHIVPWLVIPLIIWLLADDMYNDNSWQDRNAFFSDFFTVLLHLTPDWPTQLPGTDGKAKMIYDIYENIALCF